MSEFLPLINFVKTFSELNDEDEVLIQKYFQKETFKKNEIILNAGEICQKIYFVNKGILRTFHTNQNGSEFTRLFAKENEFCTILISFSEKVGSAANIQSLENSEVFSIKKSYFQEFISKSEKAKNIYTKILEDFQNFQIKRIEFLTSLTPQEKVATFLKENPELEKRLTDKMISTYLQITPETYSRTKNKLFL